jgi:DNA polymerase-3 subunit delta'
VRLLLHQLAQKRFNTTVANPPQSLLVVAPSGAGKESLLKALAEAIVGKNSSGRLFKIAPLEDKKTISIDAIRELKLTLRLKSIENRVVLITQAGLLTVEAQNSLLKLLEEPPKNTYFLLGVNNLGEVLDTIQSRTSIWRLILPTSGQLKTYFSKYPETDLTKALAIGGNKVGLVSSLLQDNANHPLLNGIEVAKEILSEKHFDRLVRVDSLSKDSAQTNILLQALELVCKAALENAASKNTKSVEQWNKRLAEVIQAQDYLTINVQPKLVLSHLFMVL